MEIKKKIIESFYDAREKNPLTPSITNYVTIDFVANAQLAVGGSAAMIYLEPEARSMAEICNSFYINVGTLLKSHKDSMICAAKTLFENNKPYVVDPVGIGIGEVRRDILTAIYDYSPSVIRANASEIIALAKLWNLDSGDKISTARGVDSTDLVDDAISSAISVSKHIGGVVCVSGEVDLVTDGKRIARLSGGSHYFEKITGAGCSLGGVMAVFCAVTDPFTAGLGATMLYNIAGSDAHKNCSGPASFKVLFLDNLYNFDPEVILNYDFSIDEV